MSYQAQYTTPNLEVPIQLGGTLPDCFLSGSEVIIASMKVAGTTANVTMYSFDPDQNEWFLFPVDPLVLDTAVNFGKGMQRYVVGRDSVGAYFTFATDADDEGDSVTVSVRLVNSK